MKERRLVLLVDDNPGDINLISEVFEACAIEAELQVARSASEAYLFLTDRERVAPDMLPDLVILDLHMPVIDGHEVLETIRTNRAWRHLPVLVLTSSQRPSDQQMAQQQQVLTYVVKPAVWDQYLAFGAQVKRLLSELAPARSA